MLPARLFRGLIRARGYSLAVIVTLGIGVAALALTLGVVDAAVWRQPPFGDAASIMILYTQRAEPGRGTHAERWSYARLRMLRDSPGGFEQVANFSSTTVNLTGLGDPEPVNGEIVSPEYFPLLRVTALRGRTFAAGDDDAAGQRPVVVIGHDFWQRRFAGDSNVIGRTVSVNGAPLTVIGVAPRGFRGLTDRAEAWIPTTMAPSLTYPE
jgi:hypothetical protein